jgi:hypothetical protein
MSEAVPNGLNVLYQGDLAHQVLPMDANYGNQATLYYAKNLMTDPVTMQFHTVYDYGGAAVAAPTLFITDVNQKVIASINLNAAPYFKGTNVLPGNLFTDAYSGAQYQLQSNTWNFTWSLFASYITPGNIYSLMLTVPALMGATKTYYSEPILLYASVYDSWLNQGNLTNTQLFAAQYKSNRAGSTNVIVSGWYNNYPTNTIPYFPTFYCRCEARVKKFDPKLINIGYLSGNYQQIAVWAQKIQQRMLKLGENSLGIPDYMLDIITELLTSDQVSITGDSSLFYEYKIWNPQAQTTPSDLWKITRNDVYHLIYANCPLTLGNANQTAMVTPTPVTYGRYHDASHDASHN